MATIIIPRQRSFVAPPLAILSTATPMVAAKETVREMIPYLTGIVIPPRRCSRRPLALQRWPCDCHPFGLQSRPCGCRDLYQRRNWLDGL